MTAPVSAARARTAPVAALAVLALLLLPAVMGGGGSARAMGALPACRYGDVLTTPRAYGDWSITLVDTILRVPKGYVPPDLVPVTGAGLAGKDRMIRAVAIDDLEAMAEAALAAGAPIGVESAYRDDADQRSLYEDWERSGAATSLEAPARPGHSEHQLGLAIDFRSDAPDAQPGQERFATTPGGRWMAAHAWEYGWLMSYPDDAEGRTCYAHEPWHFRYVGRELAARIHLSALTVREYLWSQFTTTVVPLPPGIAPGPIVSIPAGALGAVPTAGSSTAVAGPTATPRQPGPGATKDGGPPPGPSASPAAEPVDAGASVDAGTAVVAGTLAILAVILASIGITARRQRPRPSDAGPPR